MFLPRVLDTRFFSFIIKAQEVICYDKKRSQRHHQTRAQQSAHGLSRDRIERDGIGLLQTVFGEHLDAFPNLGPSDEKGRQHAQVRP